MVAKGIFMKKIAKYITGNSFKLPKADRHGMAKIKAFPTPMFVYDVNDDDAFPQEVAKYETIDGYVYYKLRNGLEGVLTAKSQEEMKQWIKEVERKLKEMPVSDTTPRPWTPKDGGQDNIQKIDMFTHKITQRFHISPPKFEYVVIKKTGIGGEYRGNVVTIVNPQDTTLADPFTFRIKPIPQPVFAAIHEFCHKIFSHYASEIQEKNILKSLQNNKLSLYGGLSGSSLEGFVELLTVYIIDPNSLKNADKETFNIMVNFEKSLT